MRALAWRSILFTLALIWALSTSLPAQTPGQLQEKQVRAEVSLSYKAFLKGGKEVMQLSEEERNTDFGPLIRSGKLQVVEGFFSSLAQLEALALFYDAQPVGPEWGTATSLLAHYTCVDGIWQLTKVETWYHDLNVQDVDADGIQELWVNLAREGLEAGGQIQSLLSYAGGTWSTLWESSGEDRRPFIDFDHEPPQAGDVLAELQTAEIRWIASEPKPVMFVRHERSVCKLPVCRSAEELESTVEWVRMVREDAKYVPAH